MSITEIINTEIPQYEDVRLWGLYRDGDLVKLSPDFGVVQTEMLASYGDCRQVTVVADKTTITTIIQQELKEQV